MNLEFSVCSKAPLEPYKCTHCPFETNYLVNLRSHSESEAPTNVNSYTCRSCDFTTFTLLIILVHQRNCSMGNETPYKINRVEYLKRRKVSRQSPKDEIRLFECDGCSYKAKSKSHLQRHFLSHLKPEEINWFRCDECAYKTRWTGTLKTHKLSKHTPKDQIRWFQCESCSYKAKRKAELERHSSCHLRPEEIKWFRCGECEYRAKRADHLKTHRVSQHAKKKTSKG